MILEKRENRLYLKSSFSSSLLLLNFKISTPSLLPFSYSNLRMKNRFEGVDYRKAEFLVVKNVVQQGAWYNCWVIVGLRVWEAMYAINNPISPPVELSPQHVIDCVFNYIPKPDPITSPNLTGVFEMMKHCGVHLHRDYPWKNAVGICEERRQGVVGKVKGHFATSYEWYNIDDLMELLDKHPIGAALHSSKKFCAHRGSGVYFHEHQEDYSMDANHAVLVIGYGYDFKIHKEYFLIQNSWGTEWGDNGFAKIDPLALHYYCTPHDPMLVNIGSRNRA